MMRDIQEAPEWFKLCLESAVIIGVVMIVSATFRMGL